MEEPRELPENAEDPQDKDGSGDELEEALAPTSLLGIILVPAALVLIIVGIVAGFWMLTYDAMSIQDYAVMLRDPNKSIRWQAALDLISTNHASPELIPILKEMLESSDSEQTLQSPIEVMRSGWTRVDALKTAEEMEVNLRWYATIALGTIPNTEAYEMLMELTGDRDKTVRLYAAFSLGRRGDPEAVDRIADLLQRDEDWGVRLASAWALGEIADPKAVPLLRTALQNDANEEVRWNCAIALARFRDFDAEPVLLEMIARGDPLARREARNALSLLRKPEPAR